MAMREDGSIDGGYITTQDSLNLVHNIRTKLDLLVIGGETVRIDRPTLDSRYAQDNIAPNILIYTNDKNIDKTIPLFNIPNRSVNILNTLAILENNNFLMIEGGYNLLKVMEDKIDMLMIFISHKNQKEKKFNFKSLGFKIIYSYFINKDDEIIILVLDRLSLVRY